MGCWESKDIYCCNSKNKSQNDHRKSKHCTDISWICVFIAFWCILILIIVFSIVYENFTVVINGSDTFGNVCGQKYNRQFENFSLSGIDTSKKPFVFYFDFRKMNTVVKTCVDYCPKRSFSAQIDIFYYFEDTFSQYCRYDFNMLRNMFSITSVLSRIGPCPYIFIKSLPLKNRCVATGSKYFTAATYDLLNSGGIIQSFILAMFSSWYYIALLCGLSLVISLLILALMVWLAKIIAYVVCSLAIIIYAALCTELWYVYSTFQSEPHEEEIGRQVSDDYYKELNPYSLNEFRANKNIILISAILTFLTTTILMYSTFAQMKELNRLKLLFEEAVSCIKYLPGLCIGPIIALPSLNLFFLLSGYTLLCIKTANYPTITPTDDDNFRDEEEKFDDRFRFFHQVEYVESKPIQRTFWIYIVGFFWTTEFIFAFEEFSISAAVAFWYFKTFLSSPSKHAIEMLFKHHFGTIAKGSAVITLLKIPRLILTFLCKRLKPKTNKLWFQRLKFVEECIGSLNHNAYAPVAMEIADFSPSAAVAGNILSKNASKVESISNVFDFVLILSKLLVASLTCLIGIFLLKNTEDLFFYMAPVLCGTFSAFCIAHVVFSIFEMTVDTLLLCACEDRLMYGGCSRSRKCNLAKLFTNNGEEQDAFQANAVKAIQKQPFRSRAQTVIIS